MIHPRTTPKKLYILVDDQSSAVLGGFTCKQKAVSEVLLCGGKLTEVGFQGYKSAMGEGLRYSIRCADGNSITVWPLPITTGLLKATEVRGLLSGVA